MSEVTTLGIPTNAATSPISRGERVALAAIVGFFTTAYTLYGLFRHWRFGSSAYDLGIFDQAIWHLSRFEAPASTIRGLTNLFGDHFHPIIALFVPLYWVAPQPEALIVAQASLLAVSIVPVYLFIRSRLARGSSISLAIAYGTFWGLQRAAAFDVHEVAFAPLVIASAILAMDRRRWSAFWIAVCVLALIKEDLIPLIAALGVYQWFCIPSERGRAVLLIVLGVVVFVLVTAFVIPAFHDHGTYAYSGSFSHVLASPWQLAAALVTPVTKLKTVLLWFAPFAFVSLFSPLSLLLAPLALARLLSASPNHWGPVFHYSAPLAPILAMSAADGLSRLAERVQRKYGEQTARRFVPAIAGVSVLLSLFLPGRQPLWRVFAPGHYMTTAASHTGRTAISMVPDSASVVAQAAVVPHLSQRDSIHVLDHDAPHADYVIAATSLSPWPASSAVEIHALIDNWRARGYVIIFEANGWTVLRRPP